MQCSKAAKTITVMQERLDLLTKERDALAQSNAKSSQDSQQHRVEVIEHWLVICLNVIIIEIELQNRMSYSLFQNGPLFGFLLTFLYRQFLFYFIYLFI